MDQNLKALAEEITELKRQRNVMLRTLREIAGDKCQKTTTGLGSCWHLFERKAQFSADRWCTSCIALDAINKATTKP